MNLIPAIPTRRVLVWDLPTRILHWLLAGSFTGAFAIAMLVRHRSPAFPLHMLLGAVTALVVVLRVLWGFVGSRYARFRSFAFGPGAVLGYLRGLVTGAGRGARGAQPGQ